MKLDYSLYMTDKSTTHSYMDFYEEIFTIYDGVPVDFLEIGVAWGGSMKMWKDFFAEGSSISGIENESGAFKTGEFRTTPIIEEQFVPWSWEGKFKRTLEGVELAEMYDDNIVGCKIYRDDARVVQIDKMFDIIIDDGSHIFDDVVVTLSNLWKNLKSGGIYVVEDVAGDGSCGWYILDDKTWKDEMRERCTGLEYEIVDRRKITPNFNETLLVFRKK